jgi:hypothetical protein
MTVQRPPFRRGGPSGRNPHGRGRGRGRGDGNNAHWPQRQPPTKFRGNCTELQGCIFDCSDYKQADTFVTTPKRISEYVGAEYKHGGDIRSSIINEMKITIPVSTAPTAVDPKSPTPSESVAEMIFKGEIDSYIKRKSLLDDNIQKTFSSVFGQCTDLIQSKLNQQAAWATISSDQDVIALIGLIKTITFRFEDQKFLPLALYLSKASIYNLRQGNMANHDYLQRYQNLVDVATSYNGQLQDQAIIDIVTEWLHPNFAYDILSDPQKPVVQTASSNLYLAAMFIHQSGRRR